VLFCKRGRSQSDILTSAATTKPSEGQLRIPAAGVKPYNIGQDLGGTAIEASKIAGRGQAQFVVAPQCSFRNQICFRYGGSMGAIFTTGIQMGSKLSSRNSCVFV
jgi:hypothetical protein